jgi:hypothetical protein
MQVVNGSSVSNVMHCLFTAYALPIPCLFTTHALPMHYPLHPIACTHLTNLPFTSSVCVHAFIPLTHDYTARVLIPSHCAYAYSHPITLRVYSHHCAHAYMSRTHDYTASMCTFHSHTIIPHTRTTARMRTSHSHDYTARVRASHLHTIILRAHSHHCAHAYISLMIILRACVHPTYIRLHCARTNMITLRACAHPTYSRLLRACVHTTYT